MIKNKRGLSAVVTTLILVLLVIVAIAIVWAVVNQLIRNRAGDIDIRQKCIESTVRPTKIICSVKGNCESITLEREGQGSGTIGGVIVGIVSDAGKKTEKIAGDFIKLGETEVLDTEINIAGGKPAAYWGVNPDQVEARVYFLDSTNTERQCEPTVVDFTAKECIPADTGVCTAPATCSPTTYTCV